MTLSPRDAAALIGHQHALSTFKRDLDAGKLAHGWLISGPRGIGKATLAYHIARLLLAGENASPAAKAANHRIQAGSHTDLLVVEPVFDEKKDEAAREITVEQARGISHFLSLTAGEAAWRVVIVDSVDALNVNGANAILKILEEPPPRAVLLLVSHHPGRLLPTIRSRCRSLKLPPLAPPEYFAVLHQVNDAISRDEAATLGVLSGWSPGIALELQAMEAIPTYAAMLDILADAPQFSMQKIQAFAEGFGGTKSHKKWHAWSQLALCMLSRIAVFREKVGLDDLMPQEKTAFERLSPLFASPLWAGKWQQASEQFMVAERLHLDYKQIIIIFLHSLLSAEGMQLGIAA